MSSGYSLTGRKALVTGSVAGIGRAIAEAFAEAGAGVVAHGLNSAEVSSVAQKWRDRGFDVVESTADLSTPDGTGVLQNKIGGWGSPDILVLNASIEIPQDWREAGPAEIQEQGMVNLYSPLLMVQAFLPAMLDRGWGRVLAIGSVQEARPNSRHIVYAATKAAQTSFMLNMARNVCAPNVTFNILKPGAIDTGRTHATLSDPARLQKILDGIPLGRVGTPEDCAGAALLLCSDAGSYINGAELHVDGGMRL